MSRNYRTYGDFHHALHLIADQVNFSIFTSDEIRKLSVKKIWTPVTFDALGFPVEGGLYDVAFGPMGVGEHKSEPCGTCLKNKYRCTGHFGYIELPLLVYNPLFHKIIYTIMKHSCHSCYNFQLPTHIKRSLSLQMHLLNSGFMTEAMEIEYQISGLVTKYETFENIPDDALDGLKKYEALIGNAIGVNVMYNKNTEELRNTFIADLFSKMKSRQACLHCKEKLPRFSTVHNKIILTIANATALMETQTKFMTPDESRKKMRHIWEVEKELILELVPVLKTINCEFPTDIFYMDLIPVPPPVVRPVTRVDGVISEHKQSMVYKAILQDRLMLRSVIEVMKNKGVIDELPTDTQTFYNLARGNSPSEKLNVLRESLQNNINHIMDSGISKSELGLKQVIEKKEGIIRMHMMGKRVNYAARSVITPDPNLNIEEIGIPEAFAKTLTYRVPVTSWNVEEMRKLILNGPNKHPGASMVEFENGTLVRIPNDPIMQQTLLKRLLTPDGGEKGYRGVKLVYRHLMNGDILLLNRQPTLHRPSIMAHTARILPGEKTLRLHYANCKAYNADFDGDEMNAHFPQSELARSEGYTLANVTNQYLVPKDGTPLSGLIQDHMIAGVKLSLRGKFFNKQDYQQLVYQALAYKPSQIQLLSPAILKPCQLWSGKQVISTVILNIVPKKRIPINLTATSKIPAQAWQYSKPRKWKAGGSKLTGNNMSEAEVIIRRGQLLVGILDKTHYGATPYGLVHCVYEIYGGTYALRLLSSLAKVFMFLLQREGFTLGVHDILVLAEADRIRSKVIQESRSIGKSVMQEALNVHDDNASLNDLAEKLEEQIAINPKIKTIVDRQYKSSLDSYTNDINKVCLPTGLISKFPHNNLQLMVLSGAKGSTVNTMQISCMLGQIELEGKRPPLMISGKSLPSFPSHEFSPRAGGFIDGRFMTGIQPQEFFFHCMAGREGLIDTAVKTSRSGYLQRCLIKHLEGLTVGYDMTVRDSDKSVIQFCYGEDGMDIAKVQFLNKKQLGILADNSRTLISESIIEELQQTNNYEKMLEHKRDLIEWRRRHGKERLKTPKPFTIFSENIKHKVTVDEPDRVNPQTGRDRKSKFISELWQSSSEDMRNKFIKKCVPCPEPVVSKYQPDYFYGSINERLIDLLDEYKIENGIQDDTVSRMVQLKAMQSLCAAGEPVGLLAAQSIGEPSTQMTLNTFHFAGRGEMNVTLGIPRLREILMMASSKIKTPSMEVPFLPVNKLEKKAEKLRKILTRVVVADVLEKIDVEQELEVFPNRQNKITLKFHFMPRKLYKNDTCIKQKQIIDCMSERFFKNMFIAITKSAKSATNNVNFDNNADKQKDDDEAAGNTSSGPMGMQDFDSDEDEDAPEDEEDAKTGNKHQKVNEDGEPEGDEIEIESDDDDEEKPKEENPDTTKTEVEDDPTALDELSIFCSKVVNNYTFAKNYQVDKDYNWCELTFHLSLLYKNVDFTAILKDVAAKTVIWEVPGIKRAITYMNNDQLTLRTDGINLKEMFKYHSLLDINKLYSNDIHHVAHTYGIEAAVKVIVREVKDVFKVYGIAVDPRHLSLIADYMTFSGFFKPLSRKGMDNSISPFQQMSFESSLSFLKSATINGKTDTLQNPSSCLMVGKPCMMGTGAFTLMHRLHPVK